MLLHIVEPSLNSYAGHCHSLVEALSGAIPEAKVHIWAGRVHTSFWQGPGRFEPYFYRPLRRFQALFLYRKLLRGPGKVLIATAGTSDLHILDWISKSPIPRGKVYLYVHWLGGKAAKSGALAKIAKRQPNLEILTTTSSVAAFFSDLGFHAHAVPYPVARLKPESADVRHFQHLLVAGAARLDKGFDRIADFVEDLQRFGSNWPVQVQCSATHRDKHPAEILEHIERLAQSGYPHLNLLRTTLSPDDYRALFKGGISLQPYSSTDFQDRVSGVTLDALSAGCPVIVTAQTWLARTVLNFGAGVATDDLSPAGLRAAVDTVLADYAGFAARAAAAGRVLQVEHSATALINAIFEL